MFFTNSVEGVMTLLWRCHCLLSQWSKGDQEPVQLPVVLLFLLSPLNYKPHVLSSKMLEHKHCAGFRVATWQRLSLDPKCDLLSRLHYLGAHTEPAYPGWGSGSGEVRQDLGQLWVSHSENRIITLIQSSLFRTASDKQDIVILQRVRVVK